MDTLVLLIASVSRVMVEEEDLGVAVGHNNTRNLVERYIAEIEGPAHSPPRRAPAGQQDPRNPLDATQ